MLPSKLRRQYQEVQAKYPRVTEENFARILVLYHGLNVEKQNSFPDHFTHYELLFTVPRLSPIPLLNLLNPDSPFELVKTDGQTRALLYEGQFVDTVTEFEQRFFDFRQPEPFYFYVTEINGSLVLKLNPVQLCDFFQNPRGLQPCGFCFRNDMVQRFKNITAHELVERIWQEETKRDNCQTLKKIDEISIVTGSYQNDDEYLAEMVTLVEGLKPKIDSQLRVVIGSHEGRGKKTFQALKKAGVTVFAFPTESIDDQIRLREMKNRKGVVGIEETLQNIEEGIAVFGPEGVIIRLVAGMGDQLNADFEARIARIAALANEAGPVWNINIYMPFTHYHWRLFQKQRPYDLDYIFKFMDIINTYVPKTHQLQFKVSP